MTVVIIVFVKTTMTFIATTTRIVEGEFEWHLKKAESVLTSKEGGDHRHHGRKCRAEVGGVPFVRREDEDKDERRRRGKMMSQRRKMRG